MEPRIERYLEALVGEARAALGDDLVGAYAAGSVAMDAYEPGRSDVDVALVCAQALTEPVKQELVGRLRHESLPCPARGLELVVYRHDVVATGSVEPAFELELNTGVAMEFRATHRPEDRPVEDGLFWYALDRSILHQSGLALLGPSASEVFADLSASDVRVLLLTSLRWWWERTPSVPVPTPGADDAVLGACRALVRHRYGEWLAKVPAGRRLLDRGVHPREVVEAAIAARTGGPPPAGDEARAFQHLVMAEISAAA